MMELLFMRIHSVTFEQRLTLNIKWRHEIRNK